MSNPSEMAARLPDAVLVRPGRDVLRPFLQRRLGIAHSDAHPLRLEHGAVVHAVAENHDLIVRKAVFLHDVLNALLFVSRLDEHGVIAEPHVGQAAELDRLFRAGRAGEKILWITGSFR